MAFNEGLYLEKLADLLNSEGNQEVAIQQSNYMKNRFVFFGLKAEKRKSLIKSHVAKYGLPPIDFLESTVKAAYAYDEREMHYFAIELLVKQKKKLRPNHLDLAEWLIVHNSWWDTVDLIASHIVGAIFFKYPALISKTGNWLQQENIWLRRTAILYQLGYKENTDQHRLFTYCKALSHEKEFFIRKAIGWALRQYAKYNPEEVKQFVAENELLNLSKREALKHF